MEDTGSSIPEICSALLKIDFLSFLPEEELNDLAGRFSVVRAAKGSLLCLEGEPALSLFIVKSGLARVWVHEHDQERLLAELKRGDFFGERGLLTGEPRAATVTAALDVELFELKKDDFDRLLISNPQFAYHVSRIVASRYLPGAQSGIRRQTSCFFSIIPSHSDLGCASFAIRLARAAAFLSGKPLLVVDMQDRRGELAQLMGAVTTPCPDPRLLDEFPNETRQLLSQSWLAAKGDVTLFELPAAGRSLAADLARVASPVMELLKQSFHLVLFVLPPEISPVSRRILQLSDGVLFMISNSAEHAGEVERKYELIRNMTAPLSVRLKVGTSHMPSGKGLYRAEIRNRLKLAEIPQVWWSLNEEKLGRTISGLSREICSRRIGLVLGAGASRGWAHLGVLRALEQRGIPIDMIAGCSIGAFVGALYAKCGSAEAAIDLAFSTFSDYRQVKRNIFDYSLVGGGGILKGNRILAVLQEMLDDADFFDLQIPLSVVTVDMATGLQVIIEEGSVSQAVRASISSPGIFRPFQMNGRWYTDGALINPLPVDVIINRGADLVLASIVEKGVNEQWPGEGGPSILNTLSRSFSIMFARTARDRARDADVAIYPDVSGYTWGDFHMGRELVRKGEEACLGKMDEIEKMIMMKE